MSAPPPLLPTPEGGLELWIDRVVVRGAGPVAPHELSAAIERELATAFGGVGALEGQAIRRVRTQVTQGAVASADGVAHAIRAAIADRLGGTTP